MPFCSTIPNHIASAVRFTEEIPGDYVILDDGAKYLICDPTYIGAFHRDVYGAIQESLSTNHSLVLNIIIIVDSGRKNAPFCNVDITKLVYFCGVNNTLLPNLYIF